MMGKKKNIKDSINLEKEVTEALSTLIFAGLIETCIKDKKLAYKETDFTKDLRKRNEFDIYLRDYIKLINLGT